jgi:hypothetical protein
MTEAELRDLANEIKTQDNAITADPIFVVFEKKKIYICGMDHECADGFDWIDCDGDPVIRSESGDETEDYFKLCGYEKAYYITVDRFVNAHFTRRSAEKYIRENPHRHSRGKLHIYVDSMWRCPEMIALRNHLLSLADQEKPCPSPRSSSTT